MTRVSETLNIDHTRVLLLDSFYILTNPLKDVQDLSLAEPSAETSFNFKSINNAINILRCHKKHYLLNIFQFNVVKNKLLPETRYPTPG